MRAGDVLLGVITVVAVVILLTPWVQLAVSAEGDYSETVEVAYAGIQGPVCVPAEDADWLTRMGIGWDLHRFVQPDDPAVVFVADALAENHAGESPSMLAESCRRWVHDSIRYVSDSEVHGLPDWWQTPWETLRLGTGDCEDKAFLLASILSHLGFVVVLVHSPDHVSMAVALPSPELYGETVTFEGETYVMCDPTFSQRTGTYNLAVEAVFPTDGPRWQNDCVLAGSAAILALIFGLTILSRRC